MMQEQLILKTVLCWQVNISTLSFYDLSKRIDTIIVTTPVFILSQNKHLAFFGWTISSIYRD